MAETLKSFLVDLGFKVDDESYRRFTGAVAGATKTVASLGVEVAGAAIAVEAAAERIAHSLQNLYYQAQLSGVGVQALQAVGYAAKQLGLDAEQGQALFEGFARAVRTNPGVQQVAAALGGQFSEVNGQIGLTQQGLFGILETLAKMPRYQALLYAPMLGFDQSSLNRILNNLPLFEQRARAAADMAKDFGLNLKEASDRGTEFSQSMGTLRQEVTFLGERAFVDLEPPLQRVIDTVSAGVKAFGEWSDKMGGIPAELAAITTAAGGVAAILRVLSKIPGFGWLFGFVSVPARLATAAITSPVGMATTATAAAVGGAVAGGKSVAKGISAGGHIIAVDPNTGIPIYDTGIGQSAPHEPTNFLVQWWNRFWSKGAKPTPVPTGTGATREQRVLAELESVGFTQPQAVGVLANLEAESDLRPTATNQGAFGIGQWRGSRLEALRQWAKSHGESATDFGTQLTFLAHELQTSESYAGYLVRSAQTARQAAEYTSLYYERPGGGYNEALRRAEIAHRIEQNITQNSTINVTGVHEPQRAAALIRDAQAGVVDQMTRLFQSQVR